MKSKDFVSFSIRGLTNPLIVRTDAIESIRPNKHNQLESKLYLKGFGANEYFIIDEPTSSIEGRL